jgi:general secretion pathway protein L
MADWLLLRLGREDDQSPVWVCVAPSGHLTQQPTSGDAAALQVAAEGRRVVLVVPGTEVLQTRVSLPPGSDSRLAQVVPNALEEQLAQDIEQLHCATGRGTDAAGRIDVDVVAHGRLSAWVKAAEALGVVVQAVYADSSLMPQVPGVVSVLIDRDTLSIARDGERPLVLPAGDATFALDMALGDTAQRAASHLVVYASSQDWLAQTAVFEALRPALASFKVQLLSAGVLPLLAAQVPQQQAINLLQGPHAPRTAAGQGWSRWRTAAAVALLLVAVHLAAQAWQWRQLSAADRQLSGQLQQQVTALLPAESGGTGLRARLQRRLAQSQSAGADAQGLLGMLTVVAAAQDASRPVRVQSLGFGRGALDLKVSGNDAAALEHISQALGSAGYRSELTAGAQRGDHYEGRIQVRMASAAAGSK